tara:strand:- start:1248 stop:1433 length:186 start_codon:yes stop_codon:yes gene_type:complete
VVAEVLQDLLLQVVVELVVQAVVELEENTHLPKDAQEQLTLVVEAAAVDAAQDQEMLADQA